MRRGEYKEGEVVNGERMKGVEKGEKEGKYGVVCLEMHRKDKWI